MWDTAFVRLSELRRSTAFRFAVALTAAFVVAYLIAGVIAFRAVSTDLDKRVIQAVELMAERYEDTFAQEGRAGLIAAVQARTRIADPEDEFIWLGGRDGERIAGQQASGVASLSTGDVIGAQLNAEADERYRVTVRDFDDLRLVTGQSYEESDAISRTVLGAFGGATALLVLLACLAAALLAWRNQRRLDRISSTLAQVAAGNMLARVPATGTDDDLERLSQRINEALEQLEATVEGIRQVSTAIAHDLRTPISRLGIRLEQLKVETTLQPGIADRLELAAAEARQITSTFDALLRIAQIEAGARKSRFCPVALPEIAIALHDAYLPVAEEHGQTLQFAIASPATPLVCGDRDLLTQLLANLLENAIRYCAAGAVIRIEVGSTQREVWISVSDNGPGIPAHEREHVTKRFYRVDQARHTPGSGLGLALAKAISDLHDGQLIFDDGDPGLIVRLVLQPYSLSTNGRSAVPKNTV
ncbi:MAG: HAMP domain-containing sensor histidine kinase [Halioglobus sp.]